MANDVNEWNKRLAALQNKGNADNIASGDLNQRLNSLQAYQNRDVNSNASNDELWSRLNHLDESNVNNDVNPYQPSLQNKNLAKDVKKSKLTEHQADALLNQIGDEINLEKTTANTEDFDLDDELDDIDDDPNLYAFMKQVENDESKQNAAMPEIKAKNEDWKQIIAGIEQNGALSTNDEKLMADTMAEVPADIVAASQKHAEQEYAKYQQQQKLYAKLGKMGVDPDEYLDKIMGDGDGDGNGSDSDDVDDDKVRALVNAAKDEAALEDKYGPVHVPNEAKPAQNNNKTKGQHKKPKNEEDDDEYWDSYADYDEKPKKKKKRGWF